jgi:energy-coupling factor transporter ATP-binding protein EcfA2
MTLLALERVTRRYGSPPHELLALRDVSLQLERGELVAVWGRRASGRSTLLRVAAGIERPDSGVVRFAGHELGARGSDALGDGIGYCRRPLARGEARTVFDEVMIGPVSRGATRSAATAHARASIERCGVEDCAARGLGELTAAEAVRVSLARALALEPELLLIDEPVTGVDLLERDDVLALLRSLADDGTAILMTVGESTEFLGADRALRIGDGSLAGSVEPELASVHHLRREATA